MRRGLGARQLLKELEATPIETLDCFVEEGTPGLATAVVKTFQAAWLALSQSEANRPARPLRLRSRNPNRDRGGCGGLRSFVLPLSNSLRG